MKKINKILTFALVVLLVLPFTFLLTGCSQESIKVKFYGINRELISSKEYQLYKIDNAGNYGFAIQDVVIPNAPAINGYNHIGWKRIWNNEFSYIDNLVEFNSDEILSQNTKFVAAYEIKSDGWNWYEDPQGESAINAFKWTESAYESPAIQLDLGENYIRFDKVTTEYALKVCKVFENGSDNLRYIFDVQILDNNGYVMDDIDLNKNVWENRTLQANQTGSYIIKITTTSALEVGILIGESFD